MWKRSTWWRRVVKSAYGSRSLKSVSLSFMCYYELPTFQKLIGSSSIRSSVNRELIKQATTRRRLRKRHLKSEVALLQTLSRLLYLSQFVKCWQFFLELNSKRLYWSSGKERESCCLVFTFSTKCEIRYFHVVVAQWRQRNIRDARAELLICRSKPFTLFCRSHWRRRRRCFSSLIRCLCAPLYVNLPQPLLPPPLPSFRKLLLIPLVTDSRSKG